MFMWKSTADTVVLLPKGLFTPLENVINEFIQPLNQKQRLTLRKCLCYYLVPLSLNQYFVQ